MSDDTSGSVKGGALHGHSLVADAGQHQVCLRTAALAMDTSPTGHIPNSFHCACACERPALLGDCHTAYHPHYLVTHARRGDSSACMRQRQHSYFIDSSLGYVHVQAYILPPKKLFYGTHATLLLGVYAPTGSVSKRPVPTAAWAPSPRGASALASSSTAPTARQPGRAGSSAAGELRKRNRSSLCPGLREAQISQKLS